MNCGVSQFHLRAPGGALNTGVREAHGVRPGPRRRPCATRRPCSAAPRTATPAAATPRRSTAYMTHKVRVGYRRRDCLTARERPPPPRRGDGRRSPRASSFGGIGRPSRRPQPHRPEQEGAMIATTLIATADLRRIAAEFAAVGRAESFIAVLGLVDRPFAHSEALERHRHASALELQHPSTGCSRRFFLRLRDQQHQFRRRPA